MFIDDDFLLDTPQAKTLFHEYAEHQPIIDYHSHLAAAAIADNRQFSNLAQLRLDGAPASSPTSPSSGWTVTITSGAP